MILGAVTEKAEPTFLRKAQLINHQRRVVRAGCGGWGEVGGGWEGGRNLASQRISTSYCFLIVSLEFHDDMELCL